MDVLFISAYVFKYNTSYNNTLAWCCNGIYATNDTSWCYTKQVILLIFYFYLYYFSQWQKAQLAKRICFVVLSIVLLLSIPTLLVYEIHVWPHNRWVPLDTCNNIYPANYSETVYTFVVNNYFLIKTYLKY